MSMNSGEMTHELCADGYFWSEQFFTHGVIVIRAEDDGLLIEVGCMVNRNDDCDCVYLRECIDY